MARARPGRAGDDRRLARAGGQVDVHQLVGRVGDEALGRPATAGATAAAGTASAATKCTRIAAHRRRAAQLYLVGGPEPQRLAELDVTAARTIGLVAADRGLRPRAPAPAGAPRAQLYLRCGAGPPTRSRPARTGVPRRSRATSRRPAGRPPRRRRDRCPGPAPVRRTARSPHQRRRWLAPRNASRRVNLGASLTRPIVPARADEGAASISAPRFRGTLKPPGTGEALTPWTAMRGSENTVIVASPPNGTSGATTSLPSWAETVASTVALRPSRVAVPRRVRRPSEEATGVTELRNGAAARRSDSATTALPLRRLPCLTRLASCRVSSPSWNSWAEARSDPTSSGLVKACRAAWPAARGSWPSAPRPSRRGARAARWRGTRRP